MIEQVVGKDHIIIKRDGRTEPYNQDKLYKVILWACDGSKEFADKLITSVSIKIHNRMPIERLYDEVIATAANLISDLYPQWEVVARNLFILKLHKELGVKRAEYPLYESVIASNVAAGMYNQEIIDQVDIPALAAAIDPSYDTLFTFGGINLFVQKYCNKYKSKLLELPQHTYMRIAIQLMYKDGTQAIIDKYHQLASMSVTEATPKVVNSLRPNAAMFSCCLVRPSDSQFGIDESIAMLDRESKFSGGCAWDSSLLRGPGSIVEGNNGKSSGAIQYIKNLQESIAGYNQGGTRSSACVTTFDAFHYQSPEKSHLKHESGKDEDRARKLQYSVKWNRRLSQAVKANEDIYLMDPHKTQDLFNSYGEEWNELYDKYCRNTHIRKRKYNARELVFEFARTSADTGNLYYFFTDNANEQDIGAGFIPASNLCVTGDTKILTKKFGYIDIEKVAGQTLECWNGSEWSTTNLFQTSEGQKVLEVKLSNSTTIKATPYHKWYVMDGYSKQIEKRTHELVPGDKLIKFDLEPIPHGNKTLPLAYVNGFHSGDGTVYKSTNKPRISLHDGKQMLLPRFSGYSTSSYSKKGRVLNLNYKANVLKDKFWVPDSSINVSDRLEWLAGYIDADGTLTNNNGAESIQVGSIELKFLQNVMLLLQELGIHSTISKCRDAGYAKLPLNDGTGEFGDFWCKEQYKLLIAGTELNKLLDLGFSPSRVIPTRRTYQRQARQFTQVVEVIDNDEILPTYCGTEPKRHKLMFNGVLTGNCQEMMMSYDPIELVESGLDSNGNAQFTYSGDIALCNLASINLAKWVTLPTAKSKEDFMYLLVKSADNAIENSFYVNPLGRKHSFKHRNLGIGTSNYANVLATNKLLWNSEGARKLTHNIYEEISFYAIKASIQLAKERSRCPVFNDTKWAQGLFPHELSKLGKSESPLNYPLLMDWESIRPDLLKYGIRNSRLLAIAPTATSGKCINATEGVDAPRKLKTIQEGTYSLPFIVPNLRENREYYQTTFQIDNKDVIELAAIRQKFLCMSQSVSLAYKTLSSAYEHISNIIYAEELGLKSIYYTHTQKAGEETEEVCESCGS